MRILVLACLLLSTMPAHAAEASGYISELLDTFKSAAEVWPPIIREHTTYLFWGLATISFTWGFVELALKGQAEAPAVIAEVVRRVIALGFFWWLFQEGPNLAGSIVDSFLALGSRLGGQIIEPTGIFDLGYNVVSSVINAMSWKAPVSALIYGFAALAVLIIIAFISLQMTVLLIQYYVILYGGVVMLALGGSEWTRNYALGYFKLILGLGVKFLVMQLIVHLALGVLNPIIATDTISADAILLLVPTLIITWGLIREIPQLAQSLVNGADQTTGNSVAGAVQMAAVAAGVVAGASKVMATQGVGVSQLLQAASQQTASQNSDPSKPMTSTQKVAQTLKTAGSALMQAGGSGGESIGAKSAFGRAAQHIKNKSDKP
ncbi:MAG: P-type conjugative transfer protein TrbL [Ferrimonas sp.]